MYNCPVCREPFHRPPSMITTEEPYCSKKCFFKDRYGERRSVRDKAIVAGFKSGRSKADLARDHGISLSRVTAILRRENADR